MQSEAKWDMEGEAAAEGGAGGRRTGGGGGEIGRAHV